MIFVNLLRNILNILDNFHQKKMIECIKKKIDPNPIVIDVGAHNGETIKIFEKKLNFKKIYSFEASPQNFKNLSKNFLNAPSSKVEIYNYAIGDKTCNAYLNQTVESSSSTINDLNQNSNYFYKKLKILKIGSKEAYSRKVPIKIITLNKFFLEKKIKTIDLLKIDTEGYEFNVLRGLSENYHRIKLVYFEHHYDDMILKNYKFRNINKLLKSYGFKKILKNKMLFRKSFEYLYENEKIK